MKKILYAVILLLFITGCTQNERAKTWGGTARVELPAGKKLLEATWKETELWYLVRDRREGEPIETYEFIEESSFGMIEGKVIFIEK